MPPSFDEQFINADVYQISFSGKLSHEDWYMLWEIVV